MATKPNDVFINCPFDDGFTPGFRALVFAVRACGFRARCAQEADDAGETRLEKIYRIIADSRFGIHDLSRTELDPGTHLPRFNMPLELGLFLGAKRFGDEDQKAKRCAVFDTEQYRYQRFISDLNGVDITAHGGDARRMVECVRNFLVTASRRKSIPATNRLLDSYDRFAAGLHDIARNAGLDEARLVFPDYERLVIEWLRLEAGEGRLP